PELWMHHDPADRPHVRVCKTQHPPIPPPTHPKIFRPAPHDRHWKRQHSDPHQPSRITHLTNPHLFVSRLRLAPVSFVELRSAPLGLIPNPPTPPPRRRPPRTIMKRLQLAVIRRLRRPQLQTPGQKIRQLQTVHDPPPSAPHTSSRNRTSPKSPAPAPPSGPH